MYKTALALAIAAPAFAAEAESEVDQTKCLKEVAEDGHVVVYEHGNYGGQWLDISGVTLKQSTKSNFSWNNRISSFRIGKGVKVTFCDHDNCHNSHAWNQGFEVVGPHESSWADVWNDRISQIRVEPHWGGAVTVFESFHCRGNSKVFTNGDYNFQQFIAKIRNDQAKGIKVDAGTTAYLYQHGGFGGWAKQITGPAEHCDLNKLAGARANDASTLKVRSSAKKSNGVWTDVKLNGLSYPW